MTDRFRLTIDNVERLTLSVPASREEERLLMRLGFRQACPVSWVRRCGSDGVYPMGQLWRLWRVFSPPSDSPCPTPRYPLSGTGARGQQERMGGSPSSLPTPTCAGG